MKKIFTLIIVIATNINAWSQCIPNTNSLVFNGSSSYANIPNNPLLVFPNHITIEAWINAAAFTNASTIFENSIVSKDGWGWGEQGFALRCGTTGATTTGKLSFVFAGLDTLGNYTSWKQVISTSSLNTNTWYHVAGTFDGDTQRCYINGVLEASLPFKGTIRDSSAYDTKIGKFAYTAGGNRYWNGKIDEVRIWNRALTKAEIDSNMNHHIDPTIQTGLVGYWRFNEGSGAVFADMSGNNLNGSLTSTTWSTSVPWTATVPAANLGYSAGMLTVTPPASHYTWYRNGVILPNDTLQTWHPTQNGQYYVVVTGANGCTGISGTITLTNVGIDELNGSDGIVILNNPVNDIATIQLGEEIIAERIEIIDINGKYIARFEKGRGNTYSLACSNFNEGLYFIRVYTNKGVVVRKLMVVR